MDAKLPETLHVDAFQMRYADIADIELDQLHALSIAVGWPHRAEDWQFLREIGSGFVALDEIGRVELPAGHVLRPLRREDLNALIAFDAPCFAVPRPVHLASLFETSVGYGLYRGEELRAYSLCRSFGRGHVLGPLAAFCEEDAIAVARPHVAAHAGRFLRVDTHYEAGAFASFIQQCGLPIYDTVTTMTLGEGAAYGTPEPNRPTFFALASQSIG